MTTRERILRAWWAEKREWDKGHLKLNVDALAGMLFESVDGDVFAAMKRVPTEPAAFMGMVTTALIGVANEERAAREALSDEQPSNVSMAVVPDLKADLEQQGPIL